MILKLKIGDEIYKIESIGTSEKKKLIRPYNNLNIHENSVKLKVSEKNIIQIMSFYYCLQKSPCILYIPKLLCKQSCISAL